jgi:hypothetical protein
MKKDAKRDGRALSFFILHPSSFILPSPPLDFRVVNWI